MTMMPSTRPRMASSIGAHLHALAVESGNQKVIPPPPRSPPVDSSDHFRKELTMKIREEETDGVRGPRAEAARGGVRNVVQSFGGGEHAAAGVRTNGTLAIQNARDGRNGNTCLRSDVFNRHGVPAATMRQ